MESMKNSLMYKLSYYKFWQVKLSEEAEPGFDILRRSVIDVIYLIIK